ncbi:short-chain dehydrogenase [Labrys sp. WJW]|uniref:SDR family oxidoreductase n=1 Tax=Labrys sp. WJW TaxID=1737983 RepID=UPI000832B9CD|nr:SDR family oxidoreductase [Labrys sp. WJW]OCC05596.1 short-chain dehydrogenase [Labrys sp. WJW]
MFENKRLAVIGGTSGIGLRVAERVLADGGEIVIGGRDAKRLEEALHKLGPKACGHLVDNRDQSSLRDFFRTAGPIDLLFTPGASYSRGRIDEVSDEVAESSFKSKFWGQYYAVKHALSFLSKDAAIVLMAGAYSVRPAPNGAAYGACNAALEGLGRALAVELAPIRVNVVSPGTIDSELWKRQPDAVRQDAFRSYGEVALLKRVGTTDEVAEAVLFLLSNGYMTGSTLYPDGGFALR